MLQGSNQILILGGTNFMGKILVDTLTKQMPTTQLYLLNRGKKYWNNEVYRDNPNIKFIYGDRNQHKQMHKAIQYLNDKTGITALRPWTAVIDFTSYKWRDIQSISKCLTNKTELYIFISTDSIYNNTAYDGTPITEQKLPIQNMYSQQKGRKIGDKYGYDKLKCQLYLSRQKHLPYIALRLPDVLGPYDNTNRYWCTLELIRQSGKYCIELGTKDVSMPISFVSAGDLSRLILRMIGNRETLEKYGSYNLCFRENISNQQFLVRVSKTLNKYQPSSLSSSVSTSSTSNPVLHSQPHPTPNFKLIPSDEGNSFYPSTNFTCLNPTLAINQLHWDPSPIDLCLDECTRFFIEHGKEYPAEFKEMSREFKRKIVEKD